MSYFKKICQCGYTVRSEYQWDCLLQDDYRCSFCGNPYKNFRDFNPFEDKRPCYVVADVDIVEVSHNEEFFRLVECVRPQLGCFDGSNEDKIIKYTEERVKLQGYNNHKNQRVLIGLSKKIQDKLGLPVDLFMNRRKDFYDLTIKRDELIAENIKLKKRKK